MINILTPLYAYGVARPAKGGFPYDHPTVGQIDRQKEINRKRKCSPVVHGDKSVVVE